MEDRDTTMGLSLLKDDTVLDSTGPMSHQSHQGEGMTADIPQQPMWAIAY
jgi:hypothetical protein